MEYEIVRQGKYSNMCYERTHIVEIDYTARKWINSNNYSIDFSVYLHGRDITEMITDKEWLSIDAAICDKYC